MACACKVNRDISYLQKRYGVKNVSNNKKETHVKQDIRVLGEKFLLSLILLPFIPILFIWTIVRVTTNHEPINISKLFRLEHVRQ